MSRGELRPVPLESAPGLAGELLGELERSLAEGFPSWGPRRSAALAEQQRAGRVELWLGRTPDEGSGALAYLQRAAEGVRVHGLVVHPPVPELIAAVLEALEAESGRPVSAMSDLVATVSMENQASILEPRGYWHREKVLLRRRADRPVPPSSSPVTIRRPTPGDREALLPLFVAAYAERPEEFWVWADVDPAAEARENLEQLFAPPGTGGAIPDLDASRLAELEGRVVGAVLVKRRVPDRRYIGDVIVAPEHQRRGIGRHLLSSTLRSLDEPPSIVELSAIRFGAPYWLYRDLGFEEVEGPEGRREGHWVRGADPTVGVRERARPGRAI